MSRASTMQGKRPTHRSTASLPELPLSPSGADIFPSWLLSRKDFQQLSAQYSSLNTIDIWEVCQRPAAARNKLETKALLSWLSDSPFLPEMKEYQLTEVCARLTSVSFLEGEVLIRKGEEADCLFLLYSGHVGIYIDNDKPVDCIYPKNVIGEVGVHSRAIRTATVVAMVPLKALKMTLRDYELVVYKVKMQQIKDQSQFLQSIPFFCDLDKGKVNRLSSSLMVKSYNKGQVIYRPGENAYDLYVVRSGMVTLNAEATIEKTNIWPISPRQSQVSVVSKMYYRTLRECRSGDFFGEEEVLQNAERSCVAQCIQESLLFIIRKEVTEEVFSEREKNKLRSLYKQRPPSAQIRHELKADHALAVTTRDALLNGICANLLPSTRDLHYKSLRKQFLAKVFIARQRTIEKKQLVHQSKQTTVIERR